MVANESVTKTAQMIREVDDFLERNRDNPRLGWPRVLRQGGAKTTTRTPPCTAEGLKVLVIGSLTLELPVEVEATRAGLLVALRNEHPEKSLRWRMRGLQVGGFVAHTTRVATSLGARVAVCTAVPIPIPGRIRAFLDENSIDCRHVVGVPGQRPVRCVFHCTDGFVVPTPQQHAYASCLDLPHAVAEDADVVLADTSGYAQHEMMSHRLRDVFDRAPHNATIGVRLDQRWDRASLAVTNSNRVWTFSRKHDAVRVLERSAGHWCSTRMDAVAGRLHREYGVTKLVLHAGAAGAVFLNGLPDPLQVHTCPIEPPRAVGAGDILLAVTAISNALGANDQESVRRGVAAATGHVAGLDLPVDLEELDAG